MRILSGFVACACLIGSAAFAGQRGQGPHVTPPAATPHATTTDVHTTTVSHPPSVTVRQEIVANPALVTRLTPLLPAGTTLAADAAGFRNEGQFVAALHVAHNLNIPFASLKTDITGTTHESLGQAIHALQPTASVKTATKTAEREAKADLKATKLTSLSTRTDTDDQRRASRVERLSSSGASRA